MKVIITTDGNDQGWLDHFNERHNHEYSLNQEVLEQHVEIIELEIENFNKFVYGPAIQLKEVPDD